MFKRILFVAFVCVIQACAFTDATLKVAHDEATDFKGPMSSVPPLSLSQPTLEDARQDKDRIGYKKNGYGKNTADIATEIPVDTIVENALTGGFQDNGHTVAQTGDIAVTGTVDRFWFEFDTNFWTVEFTGDIQCTLIFTDTASDTVIYESKYSGTYRRKTGGGLDGTWTEVMNNALHKLVEDVVYDEDLIEALQDHLP